MQQLVTVQHVVGVNTVQGFDKHTMLPGNSALPLAQKTQDLYEETCYVCFYSQSLSQCVCRTEAKHLGGHAAFIARKNNHALPGLL